MWRVKIANVAVRAERWNHNIHYHSMLLRAVPPNAQSALDVGCGEGTLTRELARCVPTVVGIDTDRRSIDEAKRQVGTAGVDYVGEDFLTHPFNAESFDFIASVATLHHMDATTALTRMRALLRPGGALVVLGLARSDSLRDLPYEAAGVLAHRVHSLTREHWEHPSPKVWPPPETYTGMRRLAGDLLPGARFRRHALWRYSIVWSKPASLGWASLTGRGEAAWRSPPRANRGAFV